jgi:hypothetical protein
MSSSTSSHCSDSLSSKSGLYVGSDKRRLTDADLSFFDSWLVSLYATVLPRTVKPIIQTYIFVRFYYILCNKCLYRIKNFLPQDFFFGFVPHLKLFPF